MYCADPEWCPVHMKNVGRSECPECLQWLIGDMIDTIIIRMIFAGWDI